MTFRNAAGQMAELLGGYVVNASMYQTRISSEVEVYNANIAIRVEAENFIQALGELKDSALEIGNQNVYARM